MKPNEFLSAVAYFFNDIIGTAVPGLLLLVLLAFVHGPELDLVTNKAAERGWVILITICVAYAIGHVVTSLHDAVRDALKRLRRLVNRGGAARSDSETPPQLLLREILTAKLVQLGPSANAQLISTLTPKDLRNVALTVSQSAGELARRFRFLALFCHGVGMSLILVAMYSFVLFRFVVHVRTVFGSDQFALWSFVGLSLVGAWLLFRKGNDFHRMSWEAPFAVAAGDLLIAKGKEEKKEDKSNEKK
jgi:hypothetical protein